MEKDVNFTYDPSVDFIEVAIKLISFVGETISKEQCPTHMFWGTFSCILIIMFLAPSKEKMKVDMPVLLS